MLVNIISRARSATIAVMAATKITVNNNGSIRIEGDFTIHDAEGKEALETLRDFLKKHPQPNPNGLIFHSRHNTPLRENNVLHDGLHPALRALGLPRAGLHAFRHGCNRRWELSGLNPAVIRQQMGHSSEKMTAHYTGQIPLEEVKAAFSKVQFSSKSGNKIVVLENMENEPAA